MPLPFYLAAPFSKKQYKKCATAHNVFRRQCGFAFCGKKVLIGTAEVD